MAVNHTGVTTDITVQTHHHTYPRETQNKAQSYFFEAAHLTGINLLFICLE